MTKDIRLDAKDLQILNLLGKDAWLTHVQIGEAIHLSPSAVQRRVERLRSKGAIMGATANIDPAAIGRKLRIYLLLELKEDNQKALERLVADLKSEHQVASVELLAGKFDILVTLNCEDTESFSNFAMETLNTNNDVIHCWTLMRLKSLI